MTEYFIRSCYMHIHNVCVCACVCVCLFRYEATAQWLITSCFLTFFHTHFFVRYEEATAQWLITSFFFSDRKQRLSDWLLHSTVTMQHNRSDVHICVCVYMYVWVRVRTSVFSYFLMYVHHFIHVIIRTKKQIYTYI